MMEESEPTSPTEATALLDPLEICTLPKTEIPERLAWIRAEILPHAIRSASTTDGVDLEFEDVPGLAEKLDRLIELEGTCCSGLRILHRENGPRRRCLEIHGADPDASLFRLLRADSTSA